MPMPAKIQKDFKAGRREVPLTMKAIQSVMDVIRIETPPSLSVFPILFSTVILGFTWSATAVMTYISSAPIPSSKNGSRLWILVTLS